MNYRGKITGMSLQTDQNWWELSVVRESDLQGGDRQLNQDV